MQVSTRSSSLVPRLWLIGILLLAWALRLAHLGSMSIWWDESLSYTRALQDLPTILSNVIPIQGIPTRDLHPPLYFVLLHFAVLAFGVSEFALRMLSTFANVLTVALLYAVAQRIARDGRIRGARVVGVLAAFFAALSPFYVWYSQEARPYALVLFWSLLAVYTLVKLLDQPPSLPSRRRGARAQSRESASGRFFSPTLLYLLALAATLATHYLSFLLLPFHAVALLIFGRKRLAGLAALLLLGFGAAFLLLPGSAAQLTGSDVGGASLVPLFIIMRDALNSFAVGVTANLDRVAQLDLAVIALFAIGTASTIRPRRGDFRLALFLLAYLFLPMLALEAGSYLRPLYLNSRHLITTSPAFYVGLAFGVHALARRLSVISFISLSPRSAPVRYALSLVAAFGLFVAGALYSLNNLYFDPAYAKDDHRGWAEFLRERIRPGDLLVLDAPQAETVYRYYAPEGLEWITLPHLVPDLQYQSWLDFTTAREAFLKHDHVWLLELHRPVADPANHVTDLLNRLGTSLNITYFRGTSTQIALQEYVSGRPVLRQTPTMQHPKGIYFGDNLQLLGYDAPAQLDAGRHEAVKLYWRLDQRTADSFGVLLRLVDDAGVTWGEWDELALGSFFPASAWPAQKAVVEQHLLPVDPAAPPGNYHLEINVYRASNHEPLLPRVKAPNSEIPLQLGEIAITRPAQPLEARQLVLDHRADTMFGDMIDFIGYNVDAENPIRPGDLIPLSLYFRLLKGPATDPLSGRVLLQPPFPFALWNGTRAAAPFRLALADRLPGDIVRANVNVRVPGDASAGDYALDLALDGISAQGSILPRAQVEIGTASVQGITRTTIPPQIAHAMDRRLGETVEFLGYNLRAPKRLHAGDSVELTLYWRARKTMDTSYTVFTHLLDARNQILGQHDSPPAAGSRPTTSWAAGEVIADTHSFVIRPDAAPGQYQIEIGLYDAATSTRVPVFDGDQRVPDDRILLEELNLQ